MVAMFEAWGLPRVRNKSLFVTIMLVASLSVLNFLRLFTNLPFSLSFERCSNNCGVSDVTVYAKIGMRETAKVKVTSAANSGGDKVTAEVKPKVVYIANYGVYKVTSTFASKVTYSNKGRDEVKVSNWEYGNAGNTTKAGVTFGDSKFRKGFVEISKPPPVDSKHVIERFRGTFPKVDAVDCQILETNGTERMNEWNEANSYMTAHPKNVESVEHFTKDTLDCGAFKEKRGYITSSMTEEERNFPIAFSLLLYKDIAQAERLLRAIYRPQNYYCIHLDSTSDKVYLDAITAIASCFDNVFMTSRMVHVHWGWFSVVEPELICMEGLMKYKKWKYFINLTGQEFPLKTNWELVRILKAYNGANGIGGTFKGLVFKGSA
jgi:hypothetical protein